MTGDKRRSLWADPPPEEPAPHADVVARVLPDEPEEPKPSPPRPDRPEGPGRRTMGTGVLAGVIVVVVLAVARAGGGSLEVKDVPSAWGDVPMTCRTARLEHDTRSLEMFRCHALRGAGRLPVGLYRSPDSLWTSDITRKEARANVMEISPKGVLRGWAAYGF